MNTNYNDNVIDALNLISVDGNTYLLGKDAGNTEGGIAKLFNDFEAYKDSVDGAYNANVIYNKIQELLVAIYTLLLNNNNNTQMDINEVNSAIQNWFNNNVSSELRAAKTTIDGITGDKYLNITSSINNTDGHTVYSISTTGIDLAIENSVQAAIVSMTGLLLTDTNTWRHIQLDGVTKLGNTVGVDYPLNIKAGDNVTITENTGTFTFSSSDTDTTYKLNINGTDNGGGNTSLGTVYCATTTGLSGLYLMSSGSGAPTWHDISIPETLPASDVPSWAKLTNKPSYNYSEIGYTVNPVSASGNSVVLDGTLPVLVVTFSSAITSVTLSVNPQEGHSCHVMFCNSSNSDLTVDVTHDAVNRICPDPSEGITLTVKSGGYAEIDFLTAGSKVYVRGI